MAGQQEVCRYYQRGQCKYGDRCRFRHPTTQKQVCSFYVEGRCRHGDKCRYHHPKQDVPQRSNRYQALPIDTGRSWNQRQGGSRNRYDLYTDDVDHGRHHQRDSDQHGRDHDVWSRLGTRSDWQDQQPPQHYRQQDSRRGRGQQWQSPDYRSTDSRHHHDRGWEDRGDRWSGQGHPLGGHPQRRRLFSQDDDKPQDSSDVVAIIQGDFKCKNLWPLSCYSYQKGAPCVPGLIEMSPEELRLLFYMAESSGNAAAFLKNLEDVNSKQMALHDLYATITPEEVKKLPSMAPQLPLSDWNSGLFGPASTASCDAAISSLFSTRASGSLNPQPLFQDIDTNTQASSIFPPAPAITTQATQSLFQPTSTQAPSVLSTNAPGPVTTQVIQGTEMTVDSVAQAAVSASSAGSTAVMQSGPSGKVTQEDLEAFKADRFELGKIPETAPPPDLR